MAKTEVAKKEEGGALQASAGVPEFLLSQVEGDQDRLGYSEKAEDSLVPILGIVQENSAEVKKRSEKFVEGVEPGFIAVRAIQRYINGDEGVVVQPCGFMHVWQEWQGEPGDGAPVGRFPFEDRPSDAEEVPDPADPERKILRRANGNRLVDTREHYVNLILEDGSIMPIVVPMSGTNHQVSRTWTNLMKQHRLNGHKTPSFYRRYRLTTRYRVRGAQSWFLYNVEDLGWVDSLELIEAGRTLEEAVRDQALEPDTREMEESPAGKEEIPI